MIDAMIDAYSSLTSRARSEFVNAVYKSLGLSHFHIALINEITEIEGVRIDRIGRQIAPDVVRIGLDLHPKYSTRKEFELAYRDRVHLDTTVRSDTVDMSSSVFRNYRWGGSVDTIVEFSRTDFVE